MDPARRSSLFRAGWLAVAAALLLAAAYSLRFRNELTITFGAESVEVRSHANVLRTTRLFSPITGATAQFNRTVTSETRVESIERSRDGANEVLLADRSIVFWGIPFYRGGIRGQFPGFQPSFGDWTADRTRSTDVALPIEVRHAGTTLTVEVAGRGDTTLRFSAADGVETSVNLNDGYIDNAISLCIAGECPENQYSQEPIRTNVARIAGTLCEIGALAAFGGALLCLLAVLTAPDEPTVPRRPLGSGGYALLALITAIHFAAAAFQSRVISGSTPHISDSAIYYRQAVLISRGMLASAPVPAEPAEAFQSNSSKIEGGRIVWFHSNHFWPAMLAAGIALNAADLVSPLLSSVSLVCIFLLGQLLYSPAIGLLAAGLYALSPFPLVLAGDYMPHLPTQAALLGAMAAAGYGERRGSRKLHLLAGALFGYGFGIRQVTALALAVPFAAGAVMRVGLRPVLRRAAWIGAGFAAIFVLFVLDNRIVTGAWFVLPHSALHGLHMSFDNLMQGLDNVDAIIGYLPPLVFASPLPWASLALIFACIPWRCDRRDLLCAAGFALLLGAHSLINVSGLHGYGPRFAFEGWAALMLLAARSLEPMIFARLRALRLAGVCFAAAAALYTVRTFGLVLPQYRDYNEVRAKVLAEMTRVARPQTIFVMAGTYWQTMDISVTLFDPTFRTLIFIQEQEDGSHRRIIDALPGWRGYRVQVFSGDPVSPLPTGAG